MEYPSRHLQIIVLCFFAFGTYAQETPKVFSYKNGSPYYAEQTMQKAQAPSHIKKVEAIPDTYKAIYFSPSYENANEIQLIRKRLKDVIRSCYDNPSCKASGFVNVWEERDKLTYNVFSKYLPVVDFNLHDPNGNLTLLQRIEIQKLVVPSLLSAGSDNIMIKPRKAEGTESFTLTKDLVVNILDLESPILFADKFCTVRLLLTSDHYNKIDVETLPGKLPYVIRVKFFCLNSSGQTVEIVSEPFLIEV